LQVGDDGDDDNSYFCGYYCYPVSQYLKASFPIYIT
jgi:hypothetical protein